MDPLGRTTTRSSARNYLALCRVQAEARPAYFPSCSTRRAAERRHGDPRLAATCRSVTWRLPVSRPPVDPVPPGLTPAARLDRFVLRQVLKARGEDQLCGRNSREDQESEHFGMSRPRGPC